MGVGTGSLIITLIQILIYLIYFILMIKRTVH